MDIVRALLPGMAWLVAIVAYLAYITWDDNGQPAVMLFGRKVAGRVVGRRVTDPTEIAHIIALVEDQEND